MTARAPAVAVMLALFCSGCVGKQNGPRPAQTLRAVKLVPLTADEIARSDTPNAALSREALDVRALSANQALALDHRLSRCLARVDAGPHGAPAAARFRTCAFRELAHSAVSQRLNATLALTITRRLRGGTCRASLLALASVARTLAAEADGVLRELNSRLTWSAGERTKLLALRALTRDTRASLDARTWRHDCAPAPVFSGRGGHQGIGQLVE